MPSTDDDIIRGGGPPSYWLKYKVWSVPGWALVLIIAAASWAVGKFA